MQPATVILTRLICFLCTSTRMLLHHVRKMRTFCLYLLKYNSQVMIWDVHEGKMREEISRLIPGQRKAPRCINEVHFGKETSVNRLFGLRYDKGSAGTTSLGELLCWDLSDGAAKFLYAIPSQHTELESMDILGNGKVVALAGVNGSVRFFETKEGKEAMKMSKKFHKSTIPRVSFSPCMRYLCTIGADFRVYVFDMRKLNEPMHSLKHDIATQEKPKDPDEEPEEKDHGVFDCSWTNAMGLSVLATTGEDFTLRLWDVTSGDPLISMFQTPDNDTPMARCVFSHDGKGIATGSDSGVVRIFATEKNKLLEHDFTKL